MNRTSQKYFRHPGACYQAHWVARSCRSESCQCAQAGRMIAHSQVNMFYNGKCA